ncbi:ReoY family proteolytic degradation factor [Barrientosiimonas marina]|uniref:UPF0302 protein ACFQU8_13610 n=1 Tax=Lentibacillus kimchii TaxID=1542911 RepID=A0ABW2UY61_9BACI
MQSPVSVQDKKSFIEWFLSHYQLKKRESVWILNYILNHQTLLSNVHFVREAKFCPRGFIISSTSSTETAFRFHKKQLVTTDPEKAFHDIRMNQNTPLYIQLSFQNENQNALYAAVLIDNPFLPDDYFITAEDQERAQKILEKTIYDYQLKTIQENINKALDKRHKQNFNKWVKQLHKLENTDG